jgi:ketosteroid isomerase-like protein
MSEQNLDAIRGFYAGFNRRDWDAALNDAAPDVVLDLSSNKGEWRGVHTGKDAVKRVLDQFVEAWESVRLELHECIDAGERAVTRTTGDFVGRDGITLQVEAAWCWTFRDGKFAHVHAYDEMHEARAAAGLE